MIVDRPATPRRDTRLSLWVVRRLLVGVVVLVVVSIVIFAVTQALPGDVAHVILGTNATPQQLTDLRHQLGLDKPLVVQYSKWISGVLRGNLGVSLQNHEPVAGIVGPRMLNSFSLGVTALLLIIPLSALVGMVTAARRDGLFDRLFLSASALFLAVPPFVVGLVLISLFATNVLTVLPGVATIPPGALVWSYPAQIALPVATLTTMGVMYLGRLVRASFIDVLDSEYIQMATLKGLTNRRILFRHALPNAVAASLPAAGLIAAITLTGVVVVEYVYSFPGLGAETVSAVGARDLPVLQACVLVLASAFYLFNLLADVVATVVRRR